MSQNLKHFLNGLWSAFQVCGKKKVTPRHKKNSVLMYLPNVWTLTFIINSIVHAGNGLSSKCVNILHSDCVVHWNLSSRYIFSLVFTALFDDSALQMTLFQVIYSNVLFERQFISRTRPQHIHVLLRVVNRSRNLSHCCDYRTEMCSWLSWSTFQETCIAVPNWVKQC